MKKIFLIIFMSLFALPVLAACPITGCAAPTDFESQSLEDRLIPNHIQQMQRTNIFQNDIQQPINGEMTTNQSDSELNNYNSNCQFGVCLPGSNKSETQNY